MRQGHKTAADLEWPQLLAYLAEGAVSERARERIEALRPAESLAAACQRMEITAAALEALALGEPVPSIGVPALEGALEHLEKGGVLALEDLDAVRLVLRGAKRLRESACRREVPRLAAHLAVDPELDRPLSSLEAALDERGVLADGASPALARLRGRLSSLRRELLDELSRQSSKHGDLLRDQGYVERDGRYGLPVRSDAHRRVEGIVLGTSSTGATLYVEPPSVTRLSNKFKLAEAEAEREESRVIAALSAALSAQQEPIARAYEACVEADVLAAISRFAQRHRARAVFPDDSHDIVLERIRHPLLARQGIEVVPHDVTLSARQALIVSGPNAGGKTVALKCLGLSVWMAQAALPLPVGEGSRIGWFAQVLTDIGDEQSIERSLSTFSAEVTNLATMMEAADDRTLVLLDEVAGGTDPDEGSALAAAVIESLVESGAAVAVTTHYERLKELAADDERLVNASVGFDFDAMAPTFTLTLGVPGASSALAVATRFGMPPAVIARARERMSRAALRREELLAQLEREKRLTTEAREAAERDAREAEALREELVVERAAVRDKERKKIEREQAGLVAKVRAARAQLEEVGRDLDEAKISRRDAEQTIAEAAKLSAIGGPLDAQRREPAKAAPPPELEVGATVYVPRLGAEATVVEAPDGDEVVVRAGVFSLRVSVSELEGGRQSAKKAPPKSHKAKKRREPTPPSALPEKVIRTEANTCDLRGMRVDEALEELERYVDGCVTGEHDEVSFALHGHGTGALKRAVREHLALSARIATSRPAEMGEGGDAFTVFRVRG